MTKNKKNIKIDRMRSYSSIYSSTMFSRLLKNDDYSFINSKIDNYDINKVGTKFDTYYDYIRYTYNELRKYYRNEYIYKNTIINELLLKQYGVKDSIVINEFRVGNSIADLVLFNGTSKAFEIKTELDSDKRLVGQLNDYSKIFRQNYIVIHESLIDKYLNIDSNVGIIALFEQPRSLKLEEIRPAVNNVNINSDTLINSIRTPEYKNIIKNHFGELPDVNSFKMFDECKLLMREIPSSVLHNLYLDELKKRKSNTSKLKSYYKELRQITLSLNLDDKSYNQLYEKLNKPIIL